MVVDCLWDLRFDVSGILLVWLVDLYANRETMVSRTQYVHFPYIMFSLLRFGIADACKVQAAIDAVYAASSFDIASDIFGLLNLTPNL